LATEAQTAFFSYSRDDSEFALRLAADLKAAGANVWLDQLDIAPGQRWARAVQDALNNCHRFLVILSPASVSSTNVEDEVAFALEEHKTVIPVLYRDCKVPFQLRPFQYIDFRTDYARGLRALLKVLGVAKPPERGIPTPPSVTKGSLGGVWNVRATEEARREHERERAAEQVRLEEGRKRWAEEDRLEKERKRIAEQARLDTVAREKVADRTVSGSRFLSKFPAWAKVAVAVCGVLIVAAVLYWALSRQRSSEQTGEAHKQQAQAETSNPQAVSGDKGAQEVKPKRQARSQPGGVSKDLNESPPKVAAQKTSQSPPAVMRVCDPVGTCGTWTWNNGHYDGVWIGVTATLTVVSFSPESVIIKRTDSGSRAGYAYVYTGKISSQGDSILNGEWSGEAGSRQEGSSGHFTATWGAALRDIPPPAVMRVCANPRDYSKCSTWTWTNGHYAGWREWGAIATMTVESFTPESVVIRRTDTGPPGPGHPGAGFTAIYVGQISSQGDSILNGQVRDNRGGIGQFWAYWGAALRDHPAAATYPH
jgi:TIR domain